MDDISVIIVSYNSGESLGQCLDSIFAQTDKNFDLVIVDNNSSDDSVKRIEQRIPALCLMRNRTNSGFSSAVNQGISSTRGLYVLVLNDDVILSTDFIAEARAAISRIPADVGMISPKLLQSDKTNIDSTGLVFTKALRFDDRGRGSKDVGQFDGKREIFGPCAAAALYSRKMLDEIKVDGEYFDEDFFLLLEDFDVAWRARKRGWKALYLPQLVCYHRGGISRTRSALAQYYTFRNRYLLLLKNGGIKEFLIFLLLVPVYEIPRLAYLLAVNKDCIRGMKEVVGLFPKLLRKRKKSNGVF